MSGAWIFLLTVGAFVIGWGGKDMNPAPLVLGIVLLWAALAFSPIGVAG